MDVFIQSALQNCFSIVVSAFLLLRMERELRALGEAINRLRTCQVCRLTPERAEYNPYNFEDPNKGPDNAI
ncbi:hypothetical protein FACS1894187_04820 [Synergistales bacterium]|nr:hypothetical protein FACS1894187_04820 [Synergistales bacterium]